MGSWLSWRQTGRRGWLAAAFPAFSLALLSKEECAALFPILVTLDLLIVHPAGGDAHIARPRRWPEWAALGGLFAILVGYLALQYVLQSRNPLVTTREYQASVGALANYLRELPAIFIPVRIVPPPWLQVTFFVGAVLFIVVLINSPLHARRLATFSVVVVFAALLPAMFFKQQPLAARYQYSGSIGAALAWAAVLWAMRSLPRRQRVLRQLIVVAYCAAFLGHLNQLHHRVRFWKKRGEWGASLMSSAASLEHKLRDASVNRRRIVVHGLPLVEPHLRSLFWLMGSVPAERIIQLRKDQPFEDSEALILEWDEEHRNLLGRP